VGKYPPKLNDLMTEITHAVESGRYLDTRHASERQLQRIITRPEVLFILLKGHHEKRKDKFDDAFQAWNYAIRGKTVDKRNLRIIVSFDEDNMLIITAIDLDI
jgi:hypothetical protein